MLEMRRVQLLAKKKELDPTSDTYYVAMDVNEARNTRLCYQYYVFNGVISSTSRNEETNHQANFFHCSDGMSSSSNSIVVSTHWAKRKKRLWRWTDAESTYSTITTSEKSFGYCIMNK